MSRIYLGGPMRGLPLFNFPAFDQGAAFLRALGHDVVNPAELDREYGFDEEKDVPTAEQVQDMLARDLREIPTCDVIAFLPGSEHSRGCQLERSVASAIGLEVWNVVPWVSFKRERPTLLVGLSGYAQSGKDTVGEMLVGAYGFERIAFADALREVVAQMHPKVATLVKAVGWDGAKQSPEIRALLQHAGVAHREVLGADVWVNAALRHVRPGGSYVITDVRFENEAAAIKNRGGYVVRVDRPGTGPINGHVSETALDGYDFDALLRNNGSLSDLASRVRLFVRSLPEVA